MMNKSQIKQFKKITKGTKLNPTMILTTWNVWHSLSTKVQQSKLRNIIVISDRYDWLEDCWTYSTIDMVFKFHGTPNNLVVVGNSNHVKNITSKINKSTAFVTIFDTELSDEPYEVLF